MTNKTLSSLLYSELRKASEVQRRMELLKPKIDSVVDSLQKLATAFEKIEMQSAKSTGSKRHQRPT